jgi:hypothetical protein
VLLCLQVRIFNTVQLPTPAVTALSLPPPHFSTDLQY